jgi:gamma-glutamylcysteine synthetase
VGQGKQSISLEPGGQFELSGAPVETLHQTCAEVNSHLYQVGFLFVLKSSDHNYHHLCFL